jgi:hypothetical protein
MDILFDPNKKPVQGTCCPINLYLISNLNSFCIGCQHQFFSCCAYDYLCQFMINAVQLFVFGSPKMRKCEIEAREMGGGEAC